MNKLNLTQSNLIGSRICHELISPIGTINNGLELIELKGDPVSSEISSIEQSSAVAAARPFTCKDMQKRKRKIKNNARNPLQCWPMLDPLDSRRKIPRRP